MKSVVSIFAALLLLGSFSFATELTGSVTNGTNGKPAAGDDVVLLKLAEGMQEINRTKTDAKGQFHFNVPDDGPHMVRVLHQGVNYFPSGGPITPGTTSTEIKVWDVGKKLQGVSVTAHVISISADNSTMNVTELYAVDNESSPPQTLMNDRPFEFYLPDGAQVDGGMAAAPGGMPVNSAPVPTDVKDRYTVIFPLRPGETRLQVSYHLPYSGQASFHPKELHSVQHLVVMVPKSMQFSGEGNFQAMPDKESDIRVLTGVEPDQQVAFNVSGTGQLSRGGESAGGAGGGDESSSGGGMAAGSNADNRPGGGLGPPTETPDPLYNYRWPIIIGLGLVLTFGAFYTLHRPQIAPAVPAPASVRAARAAGAPVTVDRSTLLLEAMKEELFQLEMDKAEGRVSQQEYEKTKAALDQTLQRAVKRRKS